MTRMISIRRLPATLGVLLLLIAAVTVVRPLHGAAPQARGAAANEFND